MGLGDLFKAKQNEDLRAKVARLEAMLTPEMQDSVALHDQIENQKAELTALQEQAIKERERQQKIMDKQEKTIAKLDTQISSLESQIVTARKDLVDIEESVLMQSFGLYRPKFAFANSTEYKQALDDLRKEQKDAIKNGKAATGNSSWTVNGSAKDGKKMVSDLQKLLIRAFNVECDDVIDHVKFNNIETAEKRIDSSCDAISKLGYICGISITPYYRKLKIKELHLAHEFQIEKQKEKERLKQLRAEERERAKVEKELAEARKKIEKEQSHFSNALAKLNQQIAGASNEDISVLLEKKAELEESLKELSSSLEQIDYRAANQRAGYVYIISNIGAFGENVYKIGMTRRLEPMDRIDELGDASVPFDFDVHALIFTEDAPALEAALHHAFEDRKLNMVNTRREFFRVTLDEIKTVVKNNFDKTVEFVDVPPAEQYRQSELMR